MAVNLSHLGRAIVQNPQEGYSPVPRRVASTRIEQILKDCLFPRDDLKAAIFIGSEHLSKDGLQGAFPSEILPLIIEALKKLDFPNARVAVKLFENILNDETYLADIRNFAAPASHRQEIIRKLKPGEFTCWYAPSFFHAMYASLYRKEDGKFLVRIHNGGQGVESHYSIDVGSNRYYQTAYEIDEVEESKVLEFIKELTEFRRDRNSKTKDLYKILIPKLGGIKLDRNPDPRLWSLPQIGGSCSGYSAYCLIKSILSVSEFEQFEDAILNTSADFLEIGLNSSWRFWKKTPYHAQALKEIRIRLFKSGKTKTPFPKMPNPSRPLLSRIFSRMMWVGSMVRSRLIQNPMVALNACLFGRSSYKKTKAELLKILSPLLLNPRLFKMLFSSDETSLLIQLYGTMEGNDLRIELKGINFSDLCKELKSPPPNWKDSGKEKWNENFELFFREAFPEEQDGKLSISGRSLAKLLVAAFDGGEKNRSEIGNKIRSALSFFKEENYKSAFHNLRCAYRLIDQVPGTLNPEELNGCMSVLRELIQWADEAPAPESTAARNHEEIEFYFANTVLFNRIGKKIGDDPNLRSIFETFGFQNVNKTWQNEYERYGRYGLSRYFSRGPWHKDLAQIESVYKENMRLLHQTLATATS